MNKLNGLLDKAKTSPFYLWLLNRLLWKMIPFNSPHRLEILKVTDDAITIRLPCRRVNMNHIKGLHACALATLCEYTCGLQLMNMLDASAYRILLQKLEMEYLFQAKQSVTAEFTLTKAEIGAHILEPLKTADAVVHSFELIVRDEAARLICKARVYWQVKPWSKVKTKI